MFNLNKLLINRQSALCSSGGWALSKITDVVDHNSSAFTKTPMTTERLGAGLYLSSLKYCRYILQWERHMTKFQPALTQVKQTSHSKQAWLEHCKILRKLLTVVPVNSPFTNTDRDNSPSNTSQLQASISVVHHSLFSTCFKSAVLLFPVNTHVLFFEKRKIRSV